jgi:hypothetical protein
MNRLQQGAAVYLQAPSVYIYLQTAAAHVPIPAGGSFPFFEKYNMCLCQNF